MKRGEVFNARLDPTEGSEQAGTRPIIIVSRDAISNEVIRQLNRALAIALDLLE
ncbi:type II toxin-antitoxin system PemK/MazF family toxin [Synechococcus sp. PCC 7336]|uniref:type II toxin-antitoxin system PemK/MazF family toxin n=1 Tax=Synechococcus sp. PCC 7336 TaxID=195250 RepID=UPI0003479C68|nr:type II toxin-antitoxin system PemK/MazF family toxin [Synechococcus sp. PCC 7336]